MRSIGASLLFAASLAAFCAHAGRYDYESDFDTANRATWPVIAIIIDDIGHRAVEGRRAVALPGPVACSVLPHTPHATRLARRAHKSGKEVMLHLPMQALDSNDLLGPGAIRLDATRDEFRRQLRSNLDAVPHVSGVNNHMGSLLTRHPGHMAWLMQDLKTRGDIFFVDSFTTPRSVAYQLAREAGVPAARRDVFLDSDPASHSIYARFEMLKQRARRHGYAVGIGHPYPTTMDFLEKALPALEKTGYRLIKVKDLIKLQARRPASAPVVRAHHQRGNYEDQDYRAVVRAGARDDGLRPERGGTGQRGGARD